MACPPLVAELVQRFRDNEDVYRSGRYNEAQLRREFVDPLFETLGWDIENRRGYAEPYKDVIHEDSIKLASGATKAPDYCFRVGGTRKFFVETKNPSVRIDKDSAPAFQLRRYAWSSKLPLSVLTNFAEFVVYDCRFRPAESDRPSRARILRFNYTDFCSRWGEIEALFGREAVLRGAFDRYGNNAKAKRGTAEVDTEFLGELERWREVLAKNVATNNSLSEQQLNTAVQATIDRIVFLRICEDRGIEPYEQLRVIASKSDVYSGLCALFEDADDRYNSGLFHFTPEKGRADVPDTLSLGLTLDDKPLREIINGLYYPSSPYEFSVLPADILGQVYEQFLGRVITITAGGRAQVELRPEVRKAGGVYYTPSYVVRHIVDSTIEPLLASAEPKSISRLRILDPSCGSGSFLLGAYELLLQWHLDWYRDHDPEAWSTGRRPAVRRDRLNEWTLTTAERKRILLNNIFGVDIDAQAVEVTKLSLLLKVLEGETRDSLDSQLRLFRERALPDLSSNIKCGNALVGVDIYTDLLSDPAERDSVNAFQWKVGFPFLEKARGFDAVIGNPPWGAELGQAELAYLRERHERVIERMVDTYIYFFDKSTELSKPDAPIGLIVPGTILNQVDAGPLRRILLDRGVREAVNLGQGIFGPKVLNTSAIIVSGSQDRTDATVKLADLSGVPLFERGRALEQITSTEWKAWRASVKADAHATFFVGDLAALSVLQKAQRRGRPLSSVLLDGIERGVTPDVVAAHILTEKEAAAKKIEPDLLRKSVTGSQVRRFGGAWSSDRLLLYTHRDLNIRNYPNAQAHLREFKHHITCKEVAEKKHPWWALHRPRRAELFSSPKFVGLTTTTRIELLYDETDDLCVTDAMYVFKARPGVDPWALLALLQSGVFLFFYRVSNQGEGRVIPQIKAAKLEALPFPSADGWGAHQANLTKLCKERLTLGQRLTRADAVERVRNQVIGVEQQIEDTVASMYGLTASDLSIVRGSVGSTVAEA